jgi:TonB family protein
LGKYLHRRNKYCKLILRQKTLKSNLFFLSTSKETAMKTISQQQPDVPSVLRLKYSEIGESAMVNGHEVPKMLLFIEERENEDYGWQPYSFVQMQRFPRKAVVTGFVAVMLLTSALFGSYMGWLAMKASIEASKKVVIAKIVLSKLPPPPVADANAIAPPPPVAVSQGPTARAGTPVPVPDALVAPDLKDFANIDQISRATTKGGNGVDTGILGLASDEVKIEVRDEEVVPDMYEFIPVEKEPYIDIKDLQRRVEYPEIARRANVQGKVLVRVLVGKNGVPVKSIVESSDSDLLDSAATRAIMKSVFTPALQNSQPVTCWVSIPVVFLMR